MKSRKKILIAITATCTLSAIVIALALSIYKPSITGEVRAFFERENHIHCPSYTHSYANTKFIKWTPDGSQIIFDHDTSEYIDQSIWSIKEDGTNLRKIADGKPYDWLTNPDQETGLGSSVGFHADLSPEGTKLVYSVCDTDKEDLDFPKGSDPGSYDLAITKMDGSKPKIITPDQGFQSYPAWSPDGTRIAFIHTDRDYISTRNEEMRIIRVQPEGNVLYPTPTPAPQGHKTIYGLDYHRELNPPVWSPDSQHIAYVRGAIAHGVPGTVHLAKVGDSTETEFTTIVGYTITQPIWSPTSSRIAFANSTINIMNPDGSEEAEVPTGIVFPRRLAWHPGGAVIAERPSKRIFPEYLAWHPGGSEILVAGTNIYSLNPHTHKFKELIDRHSMPWPATVTGIAWSPDGTKMAIRMRRESVRGYECNLYILTATRAGEYLKLIVMKGRNKTMPFIGVNKPLTLKTLEAVNAEGAGCPT